MDITVLPSTALKVVGQQLEPPDATLCRLACKQLAAVVPPQNSSSSGSDSSHIQTVASYFQELLQHDKKEQTAAAAVAASVVEAPAGNGTTQSTAAAVLMGQQQQGEDTSDISKHSSSSSSGACRSLARVASAGHSHAKVYVDVATEYDDATWQEMFSALAASSTITRLDIIEYSSNNSNSSKQLHHRSICADMAQLSVASAAEPASSQPDHTMSEVPDLTRSKVPETLVGACNWLPAVVSCFADHLEQLQLQLAAPLPAHLQPLLLRLNGLKTLKLGRTPIWRSEMQGRAVAVQEPVLLPSVVCEMSQLTGLQSLACKVAPCANKQEDIQVVLKLQQIFSRLGTTLTHLDFGTLQRATQIMLSAPLVHMPALQSLTCQPGFSLDAEDVLYPDLPDQDLAGSNLGQDADSSSSSDQPAVELVPSLTRLVLNEGWDHGPLMRLLIEQNAAAGVTATVIAAAAARTLLGHLELNSHGEIPFELLGQLPGLHSLKFRVQDKEELRLLSAQSSLTTQLAGLTVLCTQPGEQYDEWSAPYRPVPLLSGLTSLTSLNITSNTGGVLLSSNQDLPILSTAMPRLQEFSFTGNFTQLKPAGNVLQASLTGPMLQISGQISKHYVILDLPGQLRGLTLRSTTELDDDQHSLLFMSQTLPQSLTSLCVVGINSSVQQSYTSTQQKAATAADAASSSYDASVIGGAGCGSSSSSSMGLSNLTLLDVRVESMAEAAQIYRGAQALRDLRLDLHPLGHSADIWGLSMCSTPNTDSAAAGAAGSIGLPVLCPQLTSLKLKLPGMKPGETADQGLIKLLCQSIKLLLKGLTGLSRLQHLSLSCTDMYLPLASAGSLAVLSALTRLQTLELKFIPLCINSGEARLHNLLHGSATTEDETAKQSVQQQQHSQKSCVAASDAGKQQLGSYKAECGSSALPGQAVVQKRPMEELNKLFWGELCDALSHCSRLRQLSMPVSGREGGVPAMALQALQAKLPNCLVLACEE